MISSKVKLWIIILLTLVSTVIIILIFINCNYKQKEDIFSNNSSSICKINYSVTIIYDSRNRLNYRLITRQTEYFPEQEILWFTQPILIVYNVNKVPTWSIKSDRAKLTSDRILYLYDNVKAHILTTNSQLRKITANNARINLITQDIISQGSVNLYGTMFNSSGLKMYSNFRKKDAVLTGNVKTFYEIQK